MRRTPIIPPAPVGQQGPPTRAAAFDSWRSLRAARGPLLLGYRDGLTLEPGQERPPCQPWKIWGKRGKLDTQHHHVNP
jgi:hypothetical protein